ncbi:MAG: DUF177 domain-containing protein [Bacteroidaceae bacterium]|nr:DUF177 domain-containing protein [Bacteroidaceae bacterium]
MEKRNSYRIDLLDSQLKGKHFEYVIGDEFFENIEGLIHRGQLHSIVDCVGTGSIYKFVIHTEGVVIVPCDRCLADLELRIETTDELSVKLGDNYSDEGDCVVVSEAEGYLDLAQFIYEFVALSMPISCCHEPGKCDDTMMEELSRHQTARSGFDGDEVQEFDNDDAEQSESEIDPRWAALKKLKN